MPALSEENITYLTLTSVVFECKSDIGATVLGGDLTLTSVVFEFFYHPIRFKF